MLKTAIQPRIRQKQLNQSLYSMTSSFFLKTDLRFGAGVVKELPQHLSTFGWEKIALVVDAGAARNPAWQEVASRLEVEFTTTARVETSVSEPTYDYLDEVRQSFMGKEIDGFIGVGGGSGLDLAKALSVLVTNHGPAIQYRGFNLIKQPGPSLVAVPTTAGTGSEVTPNAVFTDRKERRKLGINTSLYVPKLALLDPRLTMSCPRSVIVSSGMDALTHAMESYVAKNANPISRIFSKEAFSLVFNSLSKVVDQPDNIELWARMQLGAYYAGIALMNSGAGPAGAMSYPLGVYFQVPHGLAGGVFLVPVGRLNVKRGCTLYSGLYDLIEDAERGMSVREKNVAFCDRLSHLCEKLGVPGSLKAFDVSMSDVPILAEETMQLKGAVEQNPVPIGLEEIRSILEGLTWNSR